MKLFVIACVVIALAGAIAFGFQQDHTKRSPTPAAPKGDHVLVLGGGCFWCLDSMYRQIKGVDAIECGYAGGSPAGVTYDQVCSGTTGHAEVVRVTYDPKVISGEDLLRIFFTTHNPTTLDRQGNDVGTQYRSVIFYSDEAQKEMAEKIKEEIEKSKIWDAPIVTSIEPLKNYTRAEDYHQDYFNKYEEATPAQRMSMNGGYCQAVIAPKVLHFREKFAKLLKH